MSPTPTITEAPLNATCSAGDAAGGGVDATAGLHSNRQDRAQTPSRTRAEPLPVSSLEAETQTNAVFPRLKPPVSIRLSVCDPYDASEPDAFAGRGVPSARRGAVDVHAPRLGDAEDAGANRNHGPETGQRNEKLGRRVERGVARVSLRIDELRSVFTADRRRLEERKVAPQLLPPRPEGQRRRRGDRQTGSAASNASVALPNVEVTSIIFG